MNPTSADKTRIETPKCQCGSPAEWAGEYCQECWEYHCFERFWEQIDKLTAEAQSTLASQKK